MVAEPPRSPTAPDMSVGFRMLVNWIRRHPALSGAVAVCCLLLVLLVPVLQASGFCLAQNRYLSEQEYLDAAIGEAIKRNATTIAETRNGQLAFRTVPLPRYTEVASFKDENPNCCSFIPTNSGDESPFVSTLDKMLGRAARTVLVTLTLADQPQDAARKVSMRFVVTNCGSAWR
jgi:hypothetical protein